MHDECKECLHGDKCPAAKDENGECHGKWIFKSKLEAQQATPHGVDVERRVIRAGTYFFYAGETQIINGSSTSFHALWLTAKDQTLPEVLREIVETRKADSGREIVLSAFNIVDV